MLMIEPSGQVSEAEILDSTGNRILEKTAKIATLNSFHTPAKIGDQPIQSVAKIRLRLGIEWAKLRVSGIFEKHYKALHMALNGDNFDRAESLLEKLERQPFHNLNEDTLLNIARFKVATINNASSNELLTYLTHALGVDGQTRSLPEEVYTSLLASMFALKVDIHDFQGAKKIYQHMGQSKKGRQYRDEFGSAMLEIFALEQQEVRYKVAAEIGFNEFWHFPLLKNHFTFSDVAGKLNKVKLMCSQRFGGTEYLASKDYTVPISFGDCYVLVYGKHRTTFNFWQF